MQQAYLLKSGEILYPRRAEGPDGAVGDGLDLAAAGSEEHKTWALFSTTADAEVEVYAEEIRAARAAQISGPE